ncbi:SH3 domain-containing protein [Streptomyces sp. NBC_01549]|uniref:SH3 domain-containing protein n=1 Tax=Streptomyces sp. NBC_01549 TaxID=2975874 RepID=UPI002253EFD9|nr:SH3 domain-containing protein [Streptomyces sp. NBC_01549]MCX4595107.1 SH3 domain-containing protein [Streptomyces sp. NBC_01549]
MSIRRKAAAVLAGAVLACGLLTAGTASAAAPTGRTAQSGYATYPVVPIVDAPTRSGPGNGYPAIGTLRPGYSYPALCWLSGETEVDHGSTSHIWIYVSGGAGIGNGWVSALYLRGDERADLPASAQC